ncbi:MAG: PAS domain-containing protein [Verrucomicrobia bacterium]|nr:PAS domain-containing protein [Verrucomicrobiota bacterium]
MATEPLKVLLIENDDAFARTVCGMLDQARDTVADVVTVTSLAEAIARLVQDPFGVVLLDFFLPDGAGLLNISLLKEQAPHVPVIVIGAADDETLSLEAVHAGAQDYLVKGQLTPSWLLRSIRYTVERHEADMALLAAEGKYRGIFDHLAEGIFQTTPEGRYLMANAALARIHGYATPEELMTSVTDIGRRLYVQPGRRDEFVRIMQEHDTIAGFESQVFRKDGSMIWISENCRAIRDAGGRLLYYEGTVEDITQRRQAEENLRDSETLYHSLVETIPQNIFRKDTQGCFIFANQRFCNLLGKKLDEIVGKMDFDFFPEELARKYRDDDRRVMETGQAFQTIEEHQEPGREKMFVQVVKTPLYDATGWTIGVQGIFWDITKERQMEENLRNSEALYHSLVEVMPQCIFRKDLQGRYIFANPQFCKMLNRPLDQILGRTIYDFLPRELAEKRDQDDLSVIRGGKIFEQIEESKFLSHERRFIHVLKMPIFDANGKVVSLQGMFWDITEQKMAEERIHQANAELARSQEELRVKNAVMEDDLKMAREIQLAMLPQQLPAFPRNAAPAESAFQFTHRYHPSGTVGGDFFSVTALSDTEAAVFICDVAGHGVRSALVTAMIRALVEGLRPLAHEPGRFMTKLNSELFAILKHTGTPVLTTAFCLVANSSTGKARYANAGHPKPLHIRRGAGKVETLKNASGRNQPALGLFEQAHYQTSQATLAPHDLVMLFTDGLYEVHAANQELYTEDQLATAVRKRLPSPAAQLFDEVLNEVRDFAANHEFDDDVCVVGMEFVGSPGNK